MIPKTIHYCWFGDKELSKDARKCIDTWKKYCPEYKIVKWSEKNFDVNSHPFVAQAYKEKKWAFVTDYVRLQVIYNEGGIYLDTDVVLLKNMDDLLRHPAFFGAEQLKKFVATGLGFGAEKNNSVVRKLLDSYDSVTFDIENIRMLSCPRLNTNVFLELGYMQNGKYQDIGDAVIYPPEYFDPIAPGSDENLINEITYSIHLYNASWSPTRYHIKTIIRKLIGPKKLIKIKQFMNRILK